MKMEQEVEKQVQSPCTLLQQQGKPDDGFGGDPSGGCLNGMRGMAHPESVFASPYSFEAQQPSSTTTIHFGAFRPLPASQNEQPNTAFVNNVFSIDPSGSEGASVGSSRQSPIPKEVKEEWPEDSSQDRTTPDETSRSLRRSKKRPFSDANTPCCPVCSVTVRPSDLMTHFQQEVVRLEQVAKLADRSVNRHPPREGSPHGSRTSSSPSCSKRKEISEKTEARWEVYERTKNNRNNRLSAKANRGQKKSESTPCPVCHKPITGTPEELNRHVNNCLRKREGSSEEDEQVDVEGDEGIEEYDWGGETRVRATSFLPRGGFASMGFQTHNKKNNNVDEDEDLVVDGDDSTTFGKAQYGEADVIPCKSDQPNEDRQRKLLRNALIIEHAPSGSSVPNQPSTSRWGNNVEANPDVPEDYEACSTTTASDDPSEELNHVIVSLKQRISELEAKQNPAERLKCLICMEHYVKPVVSISCWHVHCEECWLRTLGAKKLCPQCNTITSPTDLRRIFI